MTELEAWKIIEGFEAYEVSDLGRVRRRLPGNTNAVVGKIIKASPDGKGYLHVDLANGDKKTHNKVVHRLVAQAFIPNPLNLPQVNHTGEKTDNRASSLEWVSTIDHAHDRVLRGQQGDGVSFNKASGKYYAYWCPEPHRREHIGVFSTYEEAKAARDNKTKEFRRTETTTPKKVDSVLGCVIDEMPAARPGQGEKYHE